MSGGVSESLSVYSLTSDCLISVRGHSRYSARASWINMYWSFIMQITEHTDTCAVLCQKKKYNILILRPYISKYIVAGRKDFYSYFQ